jgi:hypothetical protein
MFGPLRGQRVPVLAVRQVLADAARDGKSERQQRDRDRDHGIGEEDDPVGLLSLRLHLGISDAEVVRRGSGLAAIL